MALVDRTLEHYHVANDIVARAIFEKIAHRIGDCAGVDRWV
jgi:hypothetical protein